MQTIKEIVNAPPTTYTGSTHTFNLVADQIEKRFGPEARKTYRAESNCRTFTSWLQLGYRVKKKEKSLQSVTYIEKKDVAGNVIKKFPRKVHLFFISQVERI